LVVATKEQIVQQPQEHTYRESLQRFVRHAGLKARVAAEFRSLECVARARHSPVAQYWNTAPGFLPHGYHHPTQRAPPLPPDQAVSPMCKLETDELLKLFVLMGTPDAFLERAKQMSGDDKRKDGARKAKAADGVRAGTTTANAADHAKASATAAEPGQRSKAADQARAGATAAEESGKRSKAADRARAAATAAESGQRNKARAGATAAKQSGTGQKSSNASEPAAAAYGPFAPPKLLPSRLGFGQFASSSSQPFKVKSNASGKKKAP
jgi:bromodomain-containing protein 9